VGEAIILIQAPLIIEAVGRVVVAEATLAGLPRLPAEVVVGLTPFLLLAEVLVAAVDFRHLADLLEAAPEEAGHQDPLRGDQEVAVVIKFYS
jgi:hypothetical protein